jgi:hypothetical protein
MCRFVSWEVSSGFKDTKDLLIWVFPAAICAFLPNTSFFLPLSKFPIKSCVFSFHQWQARSCF